MSNVSESGTSGLRLLVADDHQDTAQTLARLLALAGHQAAVCYDGLQALHAVQLGRPDAVLLDIGMPSLDGWELARRIRSLREDYRPLLVAVTGYGTPEDVERSHAAGIDAHVVKPADPELLLRLLEGHARTRHDGQ